MPKHPRFGRGLELAKEDRVLKTRQKFQDFLHIWGGLSEFVKVIVEVAIHPIQRPLPARFGVTQPRNWAVRERPTFKFGADIHNVHVPAGRAAIVNVELVAVLLGGTSARTNA